MVLVVVAVIVIDLAVVVFSEATNQRIIAQLLSVQCNSRQSRSFLSCSAARAECKSGNSGSSPRGECKQREQCKSTVQEHSARMPEQSALGALGAAVR